MSRYRVYVRCTHPSGCSESSAYAADTRAEEARIRSEYVAKWTCLRHSAPDEWMTPTNAKRSVSCTARKLPNCGDALFWIADGATTGSGFTFGPGFRASTKEFVEGSRLTVTVTIDPPVQS